MANEDAFLQAIIEEPDDPSLRLIYADWLEEHGETERAEFIRIQCRLDDDRDATEDWSELARLRAREGELLKKHGDAWRGNLTGLIAHQFRRGFVEHITLPHLAVRKRMAALCRAAPIRYVRFSDSHSLMNSNQLRELAEQPGIGQVPGLDFSHSPYPRPQFVRSIKGVLGAPQLRNLRRLDLRANWLVNKDIQELALTPGFALLTHLDLGDNDLTLTGVEAVLNLPHIGKLTELRLNGNKGISRRPLERLASQQIDPAKARLLQRAADRLPRLEQQTCIARRMRATQHLDVKKLTTALGDSRKDVRAAAAERLATWGATARPALPGLVQRLYDGIPEVRAAAARTLSRLATHWPESLREWMERLTCPGKTPEANLLAALDQRPLPDDTAARLARLAQRRTVWRVWQHGPGTDETPGTTQVAWHTVPDAAEAVTTLLDLVEGTACRRAEPGTTADAVGDAARVREGAWLLARVLELVLLHV